ncbi:hypothetical protein SEPCBS119000_001284 [Sporothrix epigloea]|uniref:Uncharacterized protein n=1 Tax=Sporothrix epigloea TaxID=1892477 RepID=A0ABP0D9U7_9PEZI
MGGDNSMFVAAVDDVDMIDSAIDASSHPELKASEKGAGAGKTKKATKATPVASARQPPREPVSSGSQPPAGTGPPAEPQTSPEQAQRKALPRVTSVAPAAFVPLDADADWTQPFNAPRSQAEQARFMLDTLDYYHSGVRQGFLFLADLDRRRIVGEVQAREETLEKSRTAAEAANASNSPPGTAAAPVDQEPQPKPQTQPTPLPYDDETLSHDEIDAMIDAMRAPAVSGADYNVIPLLDQQPLPIAFPPAADEVPGGRREAARQLNQVVEEVLRQISGYDAHMNGLRGPWMEILERETGKPEITEAAASNTPVTAAGSRQVHKNSGMGAAAQASAKTLDVHMSGT